MQSALELLRFKNGRKIAVLGDMLELGALAKDLHKQVGTYLHGIDILVAYGTHNEDYECGALSAGVAKENIFKCENTAEVASVLKNIARKGDVLLFKASRGMRAEDALNMFFEQRK